MSPLRHLLRTTFFELSGWKKLLVRLSLLAIALGGAAWAFEGLRGEPLFDLGGGEGSGPAALRIGAGFLGGFLLGASLRLYLKLFLILAAVLVGGGYLLAHFGLVELPWDSFGEALDAARSAAEEQTGALRDFLSGYLPAGGSGGLGLFSGATQKPSFDDD